MSFRIAFIFILIVSGVELLVSCAPSSGQETNKPVEPSNLGTSDQGGGGNTINGKPIDFYAFDITATDEYKSFVEPIDIAIQKIFPEGKPLFLKAVSQSKTWYLIPSVLSDLPKEKIGTQFASEQAARQTETEVFISEPVFKKMNLQDRGKLILHEIVMALFRVQFQKFDFYCSALTAPGYKESCLATVMGQKGQYYTARKQEEFLKSEQYRSIRDTSNWLAVKYTEMNRRDLIEQLFAHGFDDRYFNRSQYRYTPEEMVANHISKDDLWLLLNGTIKQGKLPRYCDFNFEYPSRAQAECKLSVSREENVLQISRKIKSSNDTQTLRFRFDVPNIQLSPRNFRSGLQTFTATFWEDKSKELTHDNTIHTIDLILAPVAGANYRSSAFEIIGFRFSLLSEKEQGSYQSVLPQDSEKKLEFIYYSPEAPIYREEVDTF